MLHKMGYDWTCAECEKPCRDEDIADKENGICQECHDAECDRQEKYWKPLYEGEKRAGLVKDAQR